MRDDDIVIMSRRALNQLIKHERKAAYLQVINHNVKNNSKPHHVNAPMMTAILESEVHNA